MAGRENKRKARYGSDRSSSDTDTERPPYKVAKKVGVQPCSTAQPARETMTISEAEPSLADVMAAIKGVSDDQANSRKSLEDKIDNVQATLQAELKTIKESHDHLQRRVESLEKAGAQQGAAPVRTRLVVKNVAIPADATEATLKELLNPIFQELGVQAQIQSASTPEGMPLDKKPPILVDMVSKEDYDAVMSNKAKLKDSALFSKVFIDKESSKRERMLEAIIRKLTKAIPDLEYRKGKVQKKTVTNDS